MALILLLSNPSVAAAVVVAATIGIPALIFGWAMYFDPGSALRIYVWALSIGFGLVFLAWILVLWLDIDVFD
jgi:hypothetical protein